MALQNKPARAVSLLPSKFIFLALQFFFRTCTTILSSFTHSPKTVLPNHSSDRDNVWKGIPSSINVSAIGDDASPVPHKSMITIPVPFLLNSSTKAEDL